MSEQKKGFTFIEVLLALSMFSVIALTLYGTFSSGLQLNRRAQGANRVYREIQWAIDSISRDLENCVFYDFSQSYPDKRAFKGTKETITFLLAEDDSLKAIRYGAEPLESPGIHTVIRGGYSNITQGVVTDYSQTRDREAFVREEKGFKDFLNSEDGSGEKEILSPHLQTGSVAFSYGYSTRSQQSKNIDWKDSWEDGFLPQRVRIKMTFVSQDRTQEKIEVEKEVGLPVRTLPAGEM